MYRMSVSINGKFSSKYRYFIMFIVLKNLGRRRIQNNVKTIDNYLDNSNLHELSCHGWRRISKVSPQTMNKARHPVYYSSYTLHMHTRNNTSCTARFVIRWTAAAASIQGRAGLNIIIIKP
jgi:hypothetical protein